MTIEDHNTPEPRILVGASGSAGVIALPSYLSALRALPVATITVLMTHSATAFLPAETVGLFADHVVTDADPSAWARDNHLALVDRHDLMVVFPAGAHLLAAAATGAAPNLLGASILAWEHPIVFFPVMSPSMWNNPAVRRNVAQLRQDGHLVVEPVEQARWDVASKSMTSALVPPSPAAVTSIIEEHLAVPREESRGRRV